ncbi:MAG: GNAT family N-acetyltransferase [Candidatus Omnitrophica bacterium]|nr:GNAT family N-acetyltransferase [Candidatus Omnitrophota bacterium]MBU4478490.1 GNAT family N-acetyltransferase [Candidatus Omnitrophota bacterium]MCG2704088.1 GNAT family N-acetyltransferase [Candidatus Omnitrophota bacterium]
MADMAENNDVVIRKFSAKDRVQVRRISCETAFLGAGHDCFCDDEEVLADALTLYFTDYEPESGFVAVSGEGVVGYLIGARDTARMEKIVNSKIVPGLIGKIFRKGLLRRQVNRTFLAHLLLSIFRGEFFAPDVNRQYPAILHINIDAQYRGLHIGTRLIERYVELLREQNIKGVHCGTMSDAAKEFFRKQGFSVLSTGRRTYLRYCLGKIVPFYLLGKRL